MVALFWICAGLLVWIYLGHPALIGLLGLLRPRPVRPGSRRLESVSLIIAAYNEEKQLAAKLENSLSLDWPELEVIVTSDGSTDRTNEIAAGFAEQGVKLVLCPRAGKTAAQNRAAALATAEVLVFTDATAVLESGSIGELVGALGDPSVGCATGRVVFRSPADPAKTGADLRLRLEQGLRALQSRCCSLLGATGCLYAVRRSDYRPLRPDLVSDLALPGLLLMEGRRTVYCPQATATIARPITPGREFSRRARVAMQGVRTLLALPRLGLPYPRPLVAAIYWHRLARWFSPVLLAGLLAASLALCRTPGYRAALWVQLAVYAAGGLGWALRRSRAGRGLAIPFYFCWLNLAALAGLIRAARGETGAAWETER